MLQASAAASFRRRRHRRVDASTYQCVVCGDKTRCYNFGVITCQGCKSFFRRHMGRLDKLICSKGSNCDVSKDSRKQCSACRMQKCIAVGMRPDPLTRSAQSATHKATNSPTNASTCASANSNMSADANATAIHNAAESSPSLMDTALHLASPFLPLGQPDSVVYSTDSLSVPPVNVAGLHQQYSLPPQTPLPLPLFRLPESEGESLTDDDDDAFADFYAVSSWLTATLGGAQIDCQSENARVSAAVDADKPNSLGGSSTPYVPVRAALDAADDSTLSDDVYNEILNNCANLAASQSEPWKRSELDDKLFNEPLTPDALLQMKYLEASFVRAIQSLKQSRCFKMFNKDEQLALLKASLFNAIPTFVGYRSYAEPTANVSINIMEDGRTVIKDQRFIISLYSCEGIDVRQVSAKMFGLNDLIKRAFPNDWRLVLASICILSIFPRIAPPTRSDSGSPRFRTTASAFLNATFEQKVGAVHQEHATFLRRFIRSICERDAANGIGVCVEASHGDTDATSRAEAAWQFCEEKFLELNEIGTKMQNSICSGLLKKMSSQVTPIIREVLLAHQATLNGV